ncbi:MAG: hypothetical protein ACXACU_09750 [Candidatus Hodarchaeales archaeon]|jgi:hypothetical protein
MNTITPFSWLRIEGIGLIFTALGWGLLTQIPVLFWALTLLYVDFNIFLVTIFGTTISVSIILATLSCSLAEDWNESYQPDIKRIITTSLFYNLIFLIGFFLFFLLETVLFNEFLIENFPLEFIGLNSEQRYLSAIAFGLGLAALLTFAIYKGRNLFK